MRVIDLLNKIATGEEVPKIKLDGKVYDFCTTCFCNNTSRNLIWSFPIDTLNDEIEIIEEDKEIEEINLEWFKQVDMFDPKSVELALQEEAKIINQLVKAVNELKKGK